MKNSSLRQRLSYLGITLAIALILFGVFVNVLSKAQTPSQQSDDSLAWQVKVVGPRRFGKEVKVPDTSTMKERVIENQLPSHVPIKVELRNIEVEPLLRNLEIKVTNASKKPIYFLDLVVETPEVLSVNGYQLCFPLNYGRAALIDFEEPLRPEDVPLQPGESYSFRISESDVTAFEHHLAKSNRALSNLKLIYLYFQQINFGDKTGFVGNSGTPIPNVRNGKISNGSCGGGRGEIIKPA